MLIGRRSALGGLAVAAAGWPLDGRAQGGDLLVGALNPVTGSGSPFGTGMQKMIIAAAEAVNAAGGAAGRRVVVMAEDTQTSPPAAVLAAKKLLEVNKVQAVLGTWASGVSLAVIPLTNDAGVPLFHTSGAPALSGPPPNAKGLGFRFQATNDRFGLAFAKVCAQRGFKRPATMAFNNASGVATAEGFRKAWAAQGGQVVASVIYEPAQTSYHSELSKVLAAKPDVIVTGSYLTDTTVILREWFQGGDAMSWVMPGWAASPELIAAVGPEATEGVVSVDSISNEGAASFKAYDEAYRRVMGGASGLGNVYAAMAWDMMVVHALAVQAAGSSEGAKAGAAVRSVANPAGEAVFTYAEGVAALKAGRKINYEGASSKLDFDASGDVTPDFSVSVVKGGKLVRESVVEI